MCAPADMSNALRTDGSTSATLWYSPAVAGWRGTSAPSSERASERWTSCSSGSIALSLAFVEYHGDQKIKPITMAPSDHLLEAASAKLNFAAGENVGTLKWRRHLCSQLSRVLLLLVLMWFLLSWLGRE